MLFIPNQTTYLRKLRPRSLRARMEWERKQVVVTMTVGFAEERVNHSRKLPSVPPLSEQ